MVDVVRLGRLLLDYYYTFLDEDCIKVEYISYIMSFLVTYVFVHP
jgi:hypothetical protein